MGAPDRLILMAVTWVFAVSPTTLHGQEQVPHALPGRIMGQLIDAATSEPIVDAEIRLLGTALQRSFTDGSGRFSFPSVARGVYEIEVRHLGYGSGRELVNVPEGETVHLELGLEASAIALDSLVITVDARPSRLADVGFIARQRAGWGDFFAGEDAVGWKIEHNLLSIPRVEVTGRAERRVLIRHPLFGPCIPEVYLDGILQRWAEGNITAVVAGLELDAVEVYRGITTPPEFQSSLASRPCGAIVLWRKTY